MKFDDLPTAYRRRLDGHINPTCETYFDSFINAYADDIPDDAAIVSDELTAFIRRWPGHNDPHYGISLIRITDFDDDFWPRTFELTLRYELSFPNYWLPRLCSTCSSPALRLDFYHNFRSTLAFRWYRKTRPSVVTVSLPGEEVMLDVLAAMLPSLCGTQTLAEP